MHPSTRFPQAALPANAQTAAPRSDWTTIRRLLGYLWNYRWRVGFALSFMLGARLANVGVPVLLKHLIDSLDVKPGSPQSYLVVPVGLLVAYGLLRLSTSLFSEARELIFAKATEGTSRAISLQVFRHLHDLSLRFHLERQTGGMTRDIERGTRAVNSLISYSLYNIIPTLIEVALVLSLLAYKFDATFALITAAALVIYIAFSVLVTEWRTKFRRQLNELDSVAHSKAIDSLLNYETVKYFNNEDFEAHRYDESLEKLRRVQLKSQSTLSMLNTGQQLIIATALVLMLWRATAGVVAGKISLGDLVMINAFMIQLYIPLNFLGVIYREIKQGLTDLDKMFKLLEREREVADTPDARELQISGPTVRFEDVRGVTQASLRRSIGIVPQDTVLFNDTVAYNIAYGRPGATQEEVEGAAKSAHIHGFIAATPKGYETMVGERGLKLSGGEKQRVAIARTLLKNPPILIFDEATSALDSRNERAIQAELEAAAQNKTVLVIAHRLSTVVDAHEILVLEAGHIVERGHHADLLAQGGVYARMWRLQQSGGAAEA